MARNRKMAEEEALRWVSDIDKSGKSTAALKELFAGMNDAQFSDWIEALENGKDYVPVTIPNLTKHGVTIDNNFKVAEKLGVQFFHQIDLTDPVTGITYRSPQKYLVIHLPVRRQIQTLQNKISIPEDNKHVDDLTDQPTGVSKGSALSFPEILVLYSQGLNSAVEEMIKLRGGDLKAMNFADRMIHESGGVSLQQVESLGTRVKATETLSVLMKGAHLDNNF